MLMVGPVLPQHQTECHDPLAAVRKDRGEKIVRVISLIRPLRHLLIPAYTSLRAI